MAPPQTLYPARNASQQLFTHEHGPMKGLVYLSKPRRAAAHDLALADKLSVEFGTVERQVDVEVDAVEGALRGVHAFKVLFEVFA